jgi:ribosome-associated protein
MEIAAGRRSARGDVIMREVILKTEPVELHKILKFEGLVPSGGVAKLAIESGDVIVNGEVETRKRKKIVAGDVIEFNGELIRMVL